MKFEFPEITKVSFETENVAAGAGILDAEHPTGSGVVM